MKPCCKILIGCKSSSFFGISPRKLNNHSVVDNLSKLQSKSTRKRRFRSCSSRIVEYIRVIDQDRRAFSVSDPNSGQSRVFAGFNINNSGHGSRRGILVVANVASDFRNHSTSVEANINEKNFERIYVQGGFNVKPLEIDRIETSPNDVVKEEESRVEVNGSNVNVDDLKGLNEPKFEREVSVIEKEAWRLLQDSLVTYCGNPVGTLAAKDPADKQPLNYDQVFIRDFVPSALAFLLKGETEIVKNFLLHTLQLQVRDFSRCWHCLMSVSWPSSSFIFFNIVIIIYCLLIFGLFSASNVSYLIKDSFDFFFLMKLKIRLMVVDTIVNFMLTCFHETALI